MNQTTSSPRLFHLGAILSITSKFLMPTPGYQYPIDQVYDILDFMTGEHLPTIALKSAAQECRPYLLEQHPFLRDVSFEDLRGEKDLAVWEARLADAVARYGEFHEVRPIPLEDHEILDPTEELKCMGIDESKIIVVKIDESEDPTS